MNVTDIYKEYKWHAITVAIGLQVLKVTSRKMYAS